MAIISAKAMYEVLTLICFLRMLFQSEKRDSTNILIVTAVQIYVIDMKIVFKQNFDCNSVFTLHKPF